MANLISISRIFLVLIAISLIGVGKCPCSYTIAAILTVLAFALDGLDGYVARKYHEESKLGAVLDIMGDRIAEYAYWIMFAYLGWLPVAFPLIAVIRGVVTDSLRSVALEQGLIPFGKGSMLDDKVSQWICGSKVMKISYAVVKAVAFTLLIVAYTPKLPIFTACVLWVIGLLAAEIAIILCVVRGLPVVFESKKFFVTEKNDENDSVEETKAENSEELKEDTNGTDEH